MASPSTGRWSWKTNIDSSITFSSSSSFSPSSFTFSLYKRKSSDRTKCSLDHNSSPSNEVHNKLLKKKKKSIQLQRSIDSNSLLVGGDQEDYSDSSNPKFVIDEKINKNVNPLKLPKIRLKSLFGRKSSWKRIFFASKKVRSIILLNVITVVYASDIPVLKEVEAIVDPAVFTVVRFTLSALPFLPFVLRASGNAQIRNAGLELGFWVSLGYLMQALGLLTSDAGRASFISLFTVIIVPLLDGMLGAKIPTRTWFGALMSLLGVAMLECSGSPPSVGDLLNFLSAVFFGIHMLRTEHISRSTKKEHFLSLLGYEVFVVAVFSIIWYFVGDWLDDVHRWNPESWTWTMVWDWAVKFPWIPVTYTGILSTGACLWVEMTAMRDVSATETAVIYGLEPLWGAGFAWFLLGERWGTLGWVGAAFILGGSLTVQIFGSTTNTPKEIKDGNKRLDNLLLSDKHDRFSATPVVVTTRKKDISDTLK